MKSQTKSMSFEIAIVDGINIYVREVLCGKGLISDESMAKTSSRDILDLKYDIARTLAKKWAKMPMHDDP